MSVECVALGLYDLPGGNCADWFSGTMSAVAVAFAAGSYGFSEFRLHRERREREKSVARNIGMKVFRLLNEVNNDLRHLRPRSMPRDRFPLQLDYRQIHPVVGIFFDPALSLDAVEIDLLTRAGDAQFMSDLMLGFARHRSVVESLQEYKVRYEALHAMFPPPIKAVGLEMTYSLSNEQRLKLAPHIASLNDFLNSTAKTLRENVVEVGKLADQYTVVMKRHLKVKKWMAFDLIDPAA